MESPLLDIDGVDGRKRWFQVGSHSVQGTHVLSATEKLTVTRLIEESRTHHRLRGSWSTDDKLIVVQLLDTHLIKQWRTGEIICLPYGWAGGTYGGTLTLTVLLRSSHLESNSLCRAAIFLDDPMLKIVRNESFILVIVHGNQIVRSDLVDFTISEDARLHISTFADSLAEQGARGWIDPEANFWETLFHQSIFEKYLSTSDLLSIGWFERVKSQYIIREILHHFVEDGFCDVCRRLQLDDAALGFVEAIENCAEDFRVIRDYLLNLLKVDNSRPFFEFLNQFSGLPRESGAWRSSDGFHAMLDVFFDCSAVTRAGKVMPWLNVYGDVELLEIKPRNFPEHINPREYWPRQLHDLHFGWGYLLDGSDVPLSKSELEEMLPDLPTCDDAAACDKQANFLLAEANANKQGCIPPDAVVQITIGPFVSMEVREIPVNVLVALRRIDGLVYYFTVEPHNEYWSATFPNDGNDPNSEQEIGKTKSALKLLVAAVIRDFWVVEHREMVFEQRKVTPPAIGRQTPEGPRIVYLPRVKYDYREPPSIEACAVELDTTSRRSHLVAGHLRKSSNPSTNQIALAKRYGFNVPKGYTFVKPHERGKEKRDVIYRSRSAIRSLYKVNETQASAVEVDWFRFERDVQTLMQRLGFTVEHVAASRRGDKGVDVFATKGVDLDAVRWVIQCKCWSPKRKVSPSVVRELLGTLTKYPQGTRGMIVTTSDFTSGSVDLATDQDIRLMNGDEFSSRIFGDRES